MSLTCYRLRVGPKPWQAAVEFVQALEGGGLVAARQLVDQGRAIEVELAPETAPWFAQAIVDRGLEVEASPDLPPPALAGESVPAALDRTTHQWTEEFGSEQTPIHIAYDPKHPAGAAQPLVRVSGRWEWLEPFTPQEIMRHRCVVERGRFGDWQLEHEQLVEDQAELERAIANQVERWRDEGRSIAADPVALVEHFALRNPTLEEAINAAKDPHATRQVYADWLAEKGDVRGRIAQLELALERPSSPALRVALRAELDAQVHHHSNLFAAGLDGPSSWLRDTLRLRLEGSAQALSRTLELPTLACVRHLTLERPGGVIPASAELELTTLTGLRHLACRRASPSQALALPRLRKLELSECPVTCLEGAHLPALEQLTLRAGAARAAELPAALRAAASMRVRELSIVILPSERLQPWTAVLELLPELALMAWLDRLTLRLHPPEIEAPLREAILARHGRCPGLRCTPRPENATPVELFRLYRR